MFPCLVLLNILYLMFSEFNRTMMQHTGLAIISLIVSLIYFSSIRQVTTSQNTCQPVTQTYSYVHDSMGNALCTIVTNPVNGPPGGLLVDCLKYCTSAPGWTCSGYTYYQDSKICQVFNSLVHNYARVPGCLSFRVSRKRLSL